MEKNMFRLRIRMINSAFDDKPMTEVCRILRRTAELIEAGDLEGPCIDINGNTVGEFEAS